MNKFLRDRRGETLIETLAAILIFAMASIVLYSMVTSAADINRKARLKDEAIRDQLTVAEKAEGESLEGEVTIALLKTGETSAADVPAERKTTIPIKVFRSAEDDSLYSYYKATPAAPGEGGGTTE